MSRSALRAKIPSGTYVVFSRAIGFSAYDLYGASVTGSQFGAPVLLGTLSTTFEDAGPAWSPDGTTLYLVSSLTGSFRVYTYWSDDVQLGSTLRQ